MTSHWKKAIQSPSQRCLLLNTTPDGWCPAVAMVINGRVALPFKINPAAWLSLWKSGKRKWSGRSGQVATCGPYLLAGGAGSILSKSLKGERGRERQHHTSCKCFLFLLNVRKQARGMWIEPLIGRLLSDFSPLRMWGAEKEGSVLVLGAGAGWWASKSHLKKWLFVPGYLSDLGKQE